MAQEMYIRTEWWSNDLNDVTPEIDLVSKTIFNDDTLKIIGSAWYRPEKSGSTKPVPITVDQLQRGEGWIREQLIKSQYMHRLVLANGLEGEHKAGISGTVFQGAANSNQLVISLPEPQVLRAAGVEFGDVLALAESYARAAHGISVVSSGDLFDKASEFGLKSGSKAAYAAFWGAPGIDPNPLLKRLDERGITVPYSLIAATSWPDQSTPDAKVIANIQELLS
ncbi:MAG TPA: hypothetical protein VKB05_19980 [Pyrinomonadaceae bacterium]|nr:hypothetical protein [Pyrinomonadaceae bacterium]